MEVNAKLLDAAEQISFLAKRSTESNGPDTEYYWTQVRALVEAAITEGE